MESSWSPPTSSTKRPRRRAVSAAARGRARCCRSRKSAATARNGTGRRGIRWRLSLVTDHAVHHDQGDLPTRQSDQARQPDGVRAGRRLDAVPPRPSEAPRPSSAPDESVSAHGDRLDAALLRRSLNHEMLVAGQAYPLFYDTLFADLRAELATAAQQAKLAGRGIWLADRTLAGVHAGSISRLESTGVIFPKLFRRLSEFFG